MLEPIYFVDSVHPQHQTHLTYGWILKGDMMVKYTLGDKAKHIFAGKYQFHLPTEAKLEAELKREIKEIQYQLKEGS